jgi:uncharacterized protein
MRLTLLLLLAVLGAQSSRPDVPQVEGPIRELVPPLPAGGTYISDARRLIEPGALAALNARIGALQREGLGDIGVAIIPSIGDYTPSEIGVAIYRSWRVGRTDSIGSARRNLGVLLLIVPKELAPDSSGVCWITTGRGAEGIVTDAASGRICREDIVPHLRERDYAAAVSAAIDALEERLRSDESLAAEPAAPGTAPDERAPALLWMLPAGLLAVGGGTAGALYWRRHRRRLCPTCGRKMERLGETADDAELELGQRVEERVKSVDYDVWKCGACGETVVLPYGRVFSSYQKCDACSRKTMRTARRIVKKATYTSTGLAEDTHFCEACGTRRVEQVMLPKETPPSTSSSSGRGGSFGGGRSGGGGFGGSGSTGGGGGGARY